MICDCGKETGSNDNRIKRCPSCKTKRKPTTYQTKKCFICKKFKRLRPGTFERENLTCNKCMNKTAGFEDKPVKKLERYLPKRKSYTLEEFMKFMTPRMGVVFKGGKPYKRKKKE